ncbi:MAG TPA: peptidoglycan-binding domain-containing protein [Candidatus Saccharimonadales bacterium]|nr:peptidoglycan-binding domain-containing protein [Candidatus Saccharimonadales bacterium]
MPRTKSKKSVNSKSKSKSKSWTSRASDTQRNIFIAVFIAIFALVGIIVYQKSRAASYPLPGYAYYCIKHTFPGNGVSQGCVRDIQKFVNAWYGWDKVTHTGAQDFADVHMPLSTDGILGSNTYKAIRDYQAARSLSRDGIVGPATWRAFCNSDSRMYNYGGQLWTDFSNAWSDVHCPEYYGPGV